MAFMKSNQNKFFQVIIWALVLPTLVLPMPTLAMTGTSYQVTDDSVLPSHFTQSSSSYTIDGSLEFIAGQQTGTSYKVDVGSQLKEGTTASSDTVTTASGGGGANKFIQPLPGPKPIIIGNGSAYTNSRFVTLYFDSAQTNQLNLLFNQENFPDNNWTPYVTKKTWDLGEKDGLNKFLVKFKSEHDFVSQAHGAFVTLDTIPPVKPIIKYLVANERINTSQPKFFGTAEPNIKLSLKIGQRLYWVETGADGSWSLKITPDLPLGKYVLEARAEDWAGNASETVITPFIIAKRWAPPPEPGEEIVPPEVVPPGEEKLPEYIPVIPEELPKDYWYKQISYLVRENLFNRILKRIQSAVQLAVKETGAGLALGVKTIRQGTKSIAEQAGQSLKTTARIAGRLAQQSSWKIQETLAPSWQAVEQNFKQNVILSKLARTAEIINSPFKKFAQLSQSVLIKTGRSLALVTKSVGHSMALGAKETGRTIALAVKKINNGLMSATQTSGQLAQRSRADLFYKIKNLIPTKAPSSELAQQPTIKVEEIPTLVPKEMPSDVVIVKTRKGNLDLAWAGQVDLVAGMNFYSFIKPSIKPAKVIGRLIYSQTLSYKNNFLIKEVQAVAPAEAMDWQVAEVEYKELGQNNIYVAEVNVPQVAGHYTWQTEVQLPEGGSRLYDLSAKVNERGYVYEEMERGIEDRLEKAAITLYNFNPQTNQFEIWPAKVYDQINPQITQKNGEYYFLAPAGQYRLVAKEKDHQTYQSEIITLKQPGPITEKIEMKYKDRSWWRRLLD